MTARELLSTMGLADYSLPLAALGRLLADLGVPRTEWTLRAPSLVAGLLFLVIVGRHVSVSLGRRVGLGFTACCALSPWLVIYSRVGRPYMPALLFAIAAVCAFAHGWSGGNRRPLLLWSLLAALSIWLLPVFAPFVTFPVVAALWTDDSRRTGRARLVLPAVVCAVLVVALYSPALESLVSVLGQKADRASYSPGLALGTIRLLTGFSSPTLAATAAVIALLALGMAARTAAFLPKLFLGGTLAQVIAVLVVRPWGSGDPVVFGRYLLPAIPALALGLGIAVDAVARALAGRIRSGLVPAIGAGAALGLFLLGPLPRLLAEPVLLFQRIRFTAGAGPAELPARLSAERLPAVARAGVVAIGPVTPGVHTMRAIATLDSRLRRPLVLATPESQFASSSCRFRTLTYLNPERLLATDADVFVLRLRPDLEELAAHRALGLPLRPRVARRIAASRLPADRAAVELTAAWGPADGELDGAFRVWDLDRLRAARLQNPPRRSARKPTSGE